jgi:2-oxoglutarate dehydrogenase E1 component
MQLILFFSKSLLRHPRARSDLEEMIGDTHFQRYMPDSHPETLVSPTEIKRHILCTGMVLIHINRRYDSKLYKGQVYHALLQERDEKAITDVAISRIEQISPFPYDLVRITQTLQH